MRLRRLAVVAAMAATFGVANGYRAGISPLACFQPQAVIWPPGVSALPDVEVRSIHREGSRVFVDARARSRYDQAHVDGAVSLPGDDFPAAFAALDPPLTGDVPVVIYGEGPSDAAAARVAEEMLRMGWNDVAVFPAGWQGWTRGS